MKREFEKLSMDLALSGELRKNIRQLEELALALQVVTEVENAVEA